MFVSCTVQGDLHLLVLYRTHGSNKDMFIDDLNTFNEKHIKCQSSRILVGDMNLDILMRIATWTDSLIVLLEMDW